MRDSTPGNPSSCPPGSPAVESVPDLSSLHERVLGLAHRLLCLDTTDAGDQEIDDAEISHQLALSLKPYADRLVALRRLLHPMDSIIEKRERIEALREAIAANVVDVETVSQELAGTASPKLLDELQMELAAVKRDRKLFADETETVEDDDGEGPPEPSRQPAFTERPVAERLRLVLGHRFIDLDRLCVILGDDLPAVEKEHAHTGLEAVWQGLMRIGRFEEHVRNEHLSPLRRALRDYVLAYRTPALPHTDSCPAAACTLKALRERFTDRFVGASERSLWYSRLPFYRETFPAGHWALVDGQYLNCTFKRPKIRLLMYARANDLPAVAVRQKSVLEDVYDRLVIDTAMGEAFFDNCNSITRTAYQPPGEPAKKQVHVYYRDTQIRISGKRGIPHWRPGKPRWPAVLPAIVFAPAAGGTSDG